MGAGLFLRSKRRRTVSTDGGKPFSRGALYHLLSNPVYIGEIRHKQERHPGQHEGIVSRELWERVQERLRERAARQGEGGKTEAPRSPLAGKLFDENSEPLYVQGAAKGQRRYRYYVSRKIGPWRARKMQSMGGDYPRLRLSVRSLPPPKRCLPTAMQSRRRARSRASTRIGCRRS